MTERDLAARLRHVPPQLRTALLHHARGEHHMTKRFLDLYLEDAPFDNNFINAEGIAMLIELAKKGKK